MPWIAGGCGRCKGRRRQQQRLLAIRLADGVEREGRPVHHVPASGRRDAGSTAGIDALSLEGTAAALDHEAVHEPPNPLRQWRRGSAGWRVITGPILPGA